MQNNFTSAICKKKHSPREISGVRGSFPLIFSITHFSSLHLFSLPHSTSRHKQPFVSKQPVPRSCDRTLLSCCGISHHRNTAAPSHLSNASDTLQHHSTNSSPVRVRVRPACVRPSLASVRFLIPRTCVRVFAFPRSLLSRMLRYEMAGS